MENVEYYTQRLQCSDEERDACLETAAKLCHLRYQIRRDGGLAAEALAEEEPAPFSGPACWTSPMFGTRRSWSAGLPNT